MQNFGGQTRCIMGDAQMTNAIFEKQRLHFTHISELTQQDKGDNNFSSVEKTFR